MLIWGALLEEISWASWRSSGVIRESAGQTVSVDNYLHDLIQSRERQA